MSRLREDIELLQRLLAFHDRVAKPDALVDADSGAELVDAIEAAAFRVAEYRLIDDEACILARCCRRIVHARLGHNEERRKRWCHLAERFYCAVAGDVVNALQREVS